MKQGIYKFGPENMNLSVFTFKKGILNILGCDLFIKATDFKLNMEIKGENASESKMDLELSVDSLKVVSTIVDGKMNDSILTEKYKEEIDSNIKSKSVLNAERYPKITFTSTNILEEADCLKLTGDIVIRDTTKEIEFILKKDTEGQDVRLHGSFYIYQSKFGIRPYTAMFGTIKTKDRIEIRWEFGIPDTGG